MAKRLVCLCNLVDEDEILSFLKKGAGSTKDIQNHTGAGISCGRCLPQIDDLVLNSKKENSKKQQRKIDFGI
jgi:NAD(P)H-nitrite reductase large subunit